MYLNDSCFEYIIIGANSKCCKKDRIKPSTRIENTKAMNALQGINERERLHETTFEWWNEGVEV